MARLRDPEKRTAILQAAVDEIAESGLGAPTAKIAARAGVASGTLFNYFATKEELLNELYLELKTELYQAVNQNFPTKGNLEDRTRHVWTCLAAWAIDSPKSRKVSIQLHVSGVVTSQTRDKSHRLRENMDRTLSELGSRGALRDLPDGFASAFLSALQETTSEFVSKHPKRRKQIVERSFQLLWRALNK